MSRMFLVVGIFGFESDLPVQYLVSAPKGRQAY